MSGLRLRNSTDTRVSIVQFTSPSSSSCSGVLRVWVEVTFPSVENLKAGFPSSALPSEEERELPSKQVQTVVLERQALTHL
ncbi:hypothetical protein QQF64_020826 [Cirrhinus molitorella]|uniref:Uncharacterized protein n=1 Tax=Cirrhinus molitorella TaxID=172907 RepID=A0ABR3LCU7_9TELE